MNKYLPYIIAVAAIIGLGSLIISRQNNKEKVFNSTVSLKRTDKNPYGTSVAYELLQTVFTHRDVTFENAAPGEWEKTSGTSYNQAVFFMARDRLEITTSELEYLKEFASQGNYVFLIAPGFSDEARSFLRITDYMSFMGSSVQYDTVNNRQWLMLDPFVFPSPGPYGYPGFTYEKTTPVVDTGFAKILGRHSYGAANFFRYQVGNGAIYLHTAPLAFSNYFLLYRDNIKYYEQILSVLPGSVSSIVWNEHFLNKRASAAKSDPSKFRVMMNHPPLKWGLLTGLMLIILYTLLSSRRKQRKIPFHSKPQNETLDFVKTMGRLYYDRRDHHNLARKMSIYFLEHVRRLYKIPSQSLNENFVGMLHFKTGYPTTEIQQITSFIAELDNSSRVSDEALVKFHKQLELFYQKT